MPASFVDTNILLYAISTDPAEALKKRVARDILAGSGWGLSVQVLQEFFVNATRGSAPAMTHEDAESAIRQLALRPMVENDVALMLEALRVKARYRIAYWDAAIVAAATRLGATVLYSEDLGDGQDYGGVKAVNPFGARLA
ncbi:MAG: PIN domain-containing protein [Thiobacillus sp.]|nr:PIN domain-containing protein [Thiobacillus sp.]